MLKMSKLNLIGQTFGRLKVTAEIPLRRYRGVVWKCVCSCGKEIDVRSNSLRNGNTKSCGCLAKDWNKSGNNSRKHGQSGTLEYRLYHAAKERAIKKGLPFNLRFPEDINIPEYCPILGLKLEKGTDTCGDCSPSLDRVIPELGYVRGNIVVISLKANQIKNNASSEEILKVGEWLKKNGNSTIKADKEP